MPKNPQIVIVVPGFWPDHKELVQSIAVKSGGYLFAGHVLLNTSTHQHWELFVLERDPNIARTLALTGQGSISMDDVSTIAEHSLVCVLTAEGGSADTAKQAMDASAGLLRAGGAAVYVESSGKSHSSGDWVRLSESDKPTAPYDAFVALINGGTNLYTCGMHNLGLPDASVDTTAATEDEARLLRAFNLYRLLESPDLETGHTFSLTPESTFYRLALLPCETYEEEDLFFNPFGVWRLSAL